MNDDETWLMERMQQRVLQLEQLVEERNRELSITQQQAAAVYAYLMDLNNLIPGAVISASGDGIITRFNRGAHDLLGYEEFELSGERLVSIWPRADTVLARLADPSASIVRDEALWLAKSGEEVPVMMSASCRRADGQLLSLVFVGLDLRERRRLEVELRLAQKLESLGQLAAGVAHEINTPMQFIGDNLHFVGEAMTDILATVSALQALPDRLPTAGAVELGAELARILETADLDFLRLRVPKAVERALEGVHRVSGIVSAMKAFSQPHTDVSAVDVNQAIDDTLIVARNEYKYVADIERQLEPIPPVRANRSDLNQVFLNLIVNAAHAIESRFKDSGERGQIRIRTRHIDAEVEIIIEDNGCGIPDAISGRVFDPFFTTKEVGKGTGQGLAISRTIIVDRHHGQLRFNSQPGEGTQFFIRLPIADAYASESCA